MDRFLDWYERFAYAGIEKISTPADMQALRQSALSTMRIMLLADEASRLPGLRPGPEIATRLADMAEILETGAYPVEIEPIPAEPASSPEEVVWRAQMNECLTGFATPPATVPAASPAPRAQSRESSKSRVQGSSQACPQSGLLNRSGR